MGGLILNTGAGFKFVILGKRLGLDNCQSFLKLNIIIVSQEKSRKKGNFGLPEKFVSSSDKIIHILKRIIIILLSTSLF